MLCTVGITAVLLLFLCVDRNSQMLSWSTGSGLSDRHSENCMIGKRLFHEHFVYRSRYSPPRNCS